MSSQMPELIIENAGNGKLARPPDVPASSVAGFVLMNSSLQPLSSNAEAIRILTYPEKPKPRRLDNILADKIQAVLVTQKSPPVFVPEFASGRRLYSCRTFQLNPAASNNASVPAVALLLERKAPGWFSLGEIAQEYNLTRRERQTVELLVRGLTTKEIASQMEVSPNTVKAFLRLVMIKLGVSTRSGIVGKIISNRVR